MYRCRTTSDKMKNCRECSKVYKANSESLLILKIQIFFLSLNKTMRKRFFLFLIKIHQRLWYQLWIKIFCLDLPTRVQGQKLFVIFEYSSQIFYHLIIMHFVKLKKYVPFYNWTAYLFFIFIISLSSALFLYLSQSFLYEEREIEFRSFRALCVDRNKFSFQGIILAEYEEPAKNSLPRWNRLYLDTSKHKE